MKIEAVKVKNIEDAKYGDLVFFTPTDSIFSRLIPLIDGSKYSHVAMFLGNKYGHNLFIEAQDGVGVIVNRLQEWRNYEIFRVNLPTLPISKVLSDLGKPYDRRKIIDFILSKYIKIPLVADDDHALVCSESCNKWKGYKLADKGYATPASIYNNLKIVCR